METNLENITATFNGESYNGFIFNHGGTRYFRPYILEFSKQLPRSIKRLEGWNERLEAIPYLLSEEAEAAELQLSLMDINEVIEFILEEGYPELARPIEEVPKFSITKTAELIFKTFILRNDVVKYLNIDLVRKLEEKCERQFVQKRYVSQF